MACAVKLSFFLFPLLDKFEPLTYRLRLSQVRIEDSGITSFGAEKGGLDHRGFRQEQVPLT
jgi:hypothetical protein